MPGEMDQRISIIRETTTPDGVGGQTVATAELFPAWAEVTPGSGSEQDRHDRLSGEAMYTFRIRNRRDFTIQENDRIQWEGRQYNIRFIQRPGPRQLYLMIEAERGVAQ